MWCYFRCVVLCCVVLCVVLSCVTGEGILTFVEAKDDLKDVTRRCVVERLIYLMLFKQLSNKVLHFGPGSPQ